MKKREKAAEKQKLLIEARADIIQDAEMKTMAKLQPIYDKEASLMSAAKVDEKIANFFAYAKKLIPEMVEAYNKKKIREKRGLQRKKERKFKEDIRKVDGFLAQSNFDNIVVCTHKPIKELDDIFGLDIEDEEEE
ncbi:hypothetical protein ADUPG1_006174 [Aduncisulcus paluster]|uniref:Uncharacterized protein n=1 Tax=Aduncisulcus paluster TaxID=2918883 RepID=A0ABQ5KH39_9EUKA|nr:hypothetical protein ADUPG1_006174 [Aduncisulcus paluster]